MSKLFTFLLLLAFCLTSVTVYAGNPDRQGEAGAYELLMNPWARSAGLHSMTTANVTGVNAMRINIAGLSRIESNSEIMLSHSLYLEGSGISMSSAGISQKVGKNKNGAFGISLMTLNFGDIDITTTNQPEGTGATFSPTFVNIGLGYSHIFEDKVSVGILFRSITESLADLRASTFAVDAGVQYTSGEQKEFKLGIALRNVGAPMEFEGEGLGYLTNIPEGAGSYELTVDQRAADFELQSMLAIGTSYDFLFGTENRLTVLANYTSNAFSLDQIGGGVEYAMGSLFSLRAGYRYEIGLEDLTEEQTPLYTGLAAGFSFNVPIEKIMDEKDKFASKLGIDYAYRTTKILGGTHNLSISVKL